MAEIEPFNKISLDKIIIKQIEEKQMIKLKEMVKSKESMASGLQNYG